MLNQRTPFIGDIPARAESATGIGAVVEVIFYEGRVISSRERGSQD